MYTICASACTGDGRKMWICSWPWSYFRETLLSTYLALFPLISVSFISWSYFGINDWISAESSLISCSWLQRTTKPIHVFEKIPKISRDDLCHLCLIPLPFFLSILIKWHSIYQSVQAPAWLVCVQAQLAGSCIRCWSASASPLITKVIINMVDNSLWLACRLNY